MMKTSRLLGVVLCGMWLGAFALTNGQAWIKGFDPEFPTTYRLRIPLVLPPGSVIATDARGTCALTLTIAARR